MKDAAGGERPMTAGYARIVVDRGQGRTFLKPPRAIREDEDMGEYLLCARGFVPTITLVVERELAKRVRYHVNLRAAEDTDFAIRLSLAGCKFVMARAARRGLERPCRSRPHLGGHGSGADRALRPVAGPDEAA